MLFKRGDVVLVPFPFTEKRVSQKRPAVVVSGDGYNAAFPDIIVALVTSRTKIPPRIGDHHVQSWQSAGLVKPSLVRARLSTLHTSIVIRQLGKMSAADMTGVGEGLRFALQLGESSEKHA